MDLCEKESEPRQLSINLLLGYSFFDIYHHPIHIIQGNHLRLVRSPFTDLENRVSIVLQEVHYYPHGLTFSGLAGVTQGVARDYLFNGKRRMQAPSMRIQQIPR
jgi:hypothetical protein